MLVAQILYFLLLYYHFYLSPTTSYREACLLQTQLIFYYIVGHHPKHISGAPPLHLACSSLLFFLPSSLFIKPSALAFFARTISVRFMAICHFFLQFLCIGSLQQCRILISCQTRTTLVFYNISYEELNSQRLIDRNTVQLIKGRKLLQILNIRENLSQKETFMGLIVKPEYTKIQEPCIGKTKKKIHLPF